MFRGEFTQSEKQIVIITLSLVMCVVSSCFMPSGSGVVRPVSLDFPTISRVPVLYCTDLYHPHADPDDHFDLASLYALPTADIRGVILDDGTEQNKRSGRIPIEQLNAITGRNVPFALGLGRKLNHPLDKALDGDPKFQQGVTLILDTLRTASSPVTIIIVGSARDVVAAYNREPDLFRAKLGRILAFMGEASTPDLEHNVLLDKHAFVGLMRSGLPIYWVPCFDGGLWKNHGHASYWQATQGELLRYASPELIQYFIYALEKEAADPIAFLTTPVDARRKARLFAAVRPLWCTVIFAFLRGQVDSDMFGFSEVQVSISDDALVRYGASLDSKQIMRFYVRDPTRYSQKMTRATQLLLSKLTKNHSRLK